MNVTQDNWNVAVLTGTNIDGAIAQPFRGFFRGRARKGEAYGKRFATSDLAWAYLHEHGYTQEYHHRPNGFIDLRLSPATRRFLRGKCPFERWDLLAKILKGTSCNMVRQVRRASYFRDRRHAWNHYIDTGECPMLDGRRIRNQLDRMAKKVSVA